MRSGFLDEGAASWCVVCGECAGALNLGGSVEIVSNPAGVAGLVVRRGAVQLLMPVSARRQLLELPDDLATKVNVVFCSDAADAFMKAVLE